MGEEEPNLPGQVQYIPCDSSSFSANSSDTGRKASWKDWGEACESRVSAVRVTTPLVFVVFRKRVKFILGPADLQK